MATSNQALGMTPPLSTALPTEEENAANKALLEELKRQNTFETPAETDKRRGVVKQLQAICDEFVRRVARERELGSEALIRDATGRVFPYGSFRLGVYGPGSDIDTLIVAPKYVTRDDYFDIFPALLQDMAPPGAITDLAVVRDAFVPIIKFEFSGISIDLIFSRIASLKQLPKDENWNLKDDDLLRGLDEAELRSLNGTRVTDEILALVPEPGTFRLALRAIKLWAQRRAIYANIMGFPGGVAWAMLVARVCQLYPKAASSLIVNKFFHIMRRWPWPQPVLLKPVEPGKLQVRVWNPKVYKGDQFHLMPIITPAYPSMCATYNITRSAMSIIQRELERAGKITDSVMVSQCSWSDLFVKHTFFTSGYKYYISVITTSKTKDAHKIWSGYVESKVRLLVQGLEQHPSIALAQPFNKGYDRQHICKDDQEIGKVQEGCLDYISKEDNSKGDEVLVKAEAKIDEAVPAAVIKPETDDGVKHVRVSSPSGQALTGTSDVQEGILEDKQEDAIAGQTEIFTTTHYIGLELASAAKRLGYANLLGAKSLDLSYQVDNFKQICGQWDKFDAQLNHLSIQHVRNFDLPDDVFEPGEKKPPRPKKKAAAANGTAAPVKKRSASEDEQPPAKRQQSSIPAAG